MIPDVWQQALSKANSLTPKQLEKQFGPEVSRWALQQIELRKKARSKFADPESMLFEREALEQATHEEVAKYHASRFPAEAQVADITCGIGSDLRAFISAIGFELDADRAFYARHNSNAEVRIDDGLGYVLSHDVPYIWADPDRRDSSGRRLADPSSYSPNPLDIPRDRELTGIKLSPLLSDEYLTSVGDRVEFISYRGECREAIAWSGHAIQSDDLTGLPLWQERSLRSKIETGESNEPSGIYAVRVENGATLSRKEIFDVEADPSEFIYDADPAAVRAHALGHFNLPQLGDSPGYLTGPLIESDWLTPYQVVASGSFDVKRIKEALRTHGLRVFEVKQRGAGLDPATVMKQVKTDGDPVSLIAWRVEKSVRFALATRA